jgi:DedD protein
MEQPLKQRLIGAAVLAALAVIFLPMLLKGPDVREPDAAEVPLTMPATPGQDFETRELPLTMPEPAPAGGALGMSPAPAPADVDTVAGDPPPPGDDEATDPAPAEAPAPAPAATASEAATAGGDFVVSIGSFGNLANASALVARLRAAGLPVLVDAVRIGGAEGRRIRVGPYSDRAAAEAARLRARSAANAAGTVVALDGKPLPPAAALPAPTPGVAATPPAKPAAPAPKPATPAAPAPAPPEPAAAVNAGFAVQLSAPSVEAEAIALRDKARAQGFSSFVQRIEVDGGTRYRVRIGPYADRSDAESARDAANGKLGTKGIVMRHP